MCVVVLCPCYIKELENFDRNIQINVIWKLEKTTNISMSIFHRESILLKSKHSFVSGYFLGSISLESIDLWK